MKYILLITQITILLLFISCSSEIKSTDNQQNKTDNAKVPYIYQNNKQTKNIKQKGNLIVKLAATELGTALKKEIKKGGAENAINFCNHNAMSITDSLANAEGVTIRRLAKKNRNPKNETNAVESKIYKQYVAEWQSNKTMEPKIVIDKNGHPVFYKPIIINKKCLTCHGKLGETMPQNISLKIKELYPDDKAINFEDGHPRGMWAITFNDIKIGE